jgi:hypothetical protein
MPSSWTSSIAALSANPAARGAGLMVYYLAILVGLLWLYGAGEWSTPSFVYQGF